MQSFEDSIKEFNGEQIFCRHLKPQNGQDPKCLVFVCHGFGEHIGRYSEFFEILSKQSMYVFGHDHVGHGKSSGHRAWIENYDQFTTIARMHIEETTARFPGKKLFIYGHSMGGLISSKLLVNMPQLATGGLILEGPFLGVPACSPEWQIKIAVLLGRLWFVRCLPASKINPAHVSRDAEMAKDYAEDPLVFHGLVNMRMASMSNEAREEVFDNVKKLSMSLLVTHGVEDQLSPISAAEMLYKEAGSGDKTFKAYEGGYHVLRFEPYNGIKDTFLKQVIDWIDVRC